MEESSYIAAAKRDPKEFRYFYDAYYKNIFLFIYRRTDDESLSADITQQVFLKAMQHIDKYVDRGFPFSSWLYRIAANELAQHFRDAQKIRVVCVEQSGLNELCEDDAAAFDMTKRESLFAAIKKLEGAELELIEMRYFEKRPFKEIAGIKNISEANAKVKVHRILEKIRNLITIEV